MLKEDVKPKRCGAASASTSSKWKRPFGHAGRALGITQPHREEAALKGPSRAEAPEWVQSERNDVLLTKPSIVFQFK